MKRNIDWFALFLITLIVSGCATQQKGAVENLADSRKQMDNIRGQIDRTMFSIDSLLRAPAAEINGAQQEYSSNVKSLRKMADQLDDGAKSAREHRIDYLTEWERAQLSVDNPELRRASEQRRKDVVQSLTNLEVSMRSASEGVAPLLAELEDIERVTTNDPTPAGIASVKKSGITQVAQRHARTANYRLDVAAGRFDRALAVLSPQPGTRPVAPTVQAAPASSKPSTQNGGTESKSPPASTTPAPR